MCADRKRPGQRPYDDATTEVPAMPDAVAAAEREAAALDAPTLDEALGFEPLPPTPTTRRPASRPVPRRPGTSPRRVAGTGTGAAGGTGPSIIVDDEPPLDTDSTLAPGPPRPLEPEPEVTRLGPLPFEAELEDRAGNTETDHRREGLAQRIEAARAEEERRREADAVARAEARAAEEAARPEGAPARRGALRPDGERGPDAPITEPSRPATADTGVVVAASAVARASEPHAPVAAARAVEPGRVQVRSPGLKRRGEGAPEAGVEAELARAQHDATLSFGDAPSGQLVRAAVAARDKEKERAVDVQSAETATGRVRVTTEPGTGGRSRREPTDPSGPPAAMPVVARRKTEPGVAIKSGSAGEGAKRREKTDPSGPPALIAQAQRELTEPSTAAVPSAPAPHASALAEAQRAPTNPASGAGATKVGASAERTRVDAQSHQTEPAATLPPVATDVRVDAQRLVTMPATPMASDDDPVSHAEAAASALVAARQAAPTVAERAAAPASSGDVTVVSAEQTHVAVQHGSSSEPDGKGAGGLVRRNREGAPVT